eukprot:gene11530-11673_t
MVLKSATNDGQRPPQDVAALLDLKASIIDPSCASNAGFCSIFNTWASGTQPCSTPDCTPCKLSHAACGVYDAATNSTLCNWRYLQCRESRVIKILLGTLPPEWSGLASLRELSITRAPDITGSIPAAWSALSQLQVLELSDLSIANEWPWLSLPDLTRLTLENMPQLMLPIGSLAAWATNISMEWLELRNVGGMAGRGLDTLGVMYPKLKALVLSQLGLTGPVPPSWESLWPPGSLHQLDLALNNLTGGLPEWLSRPLAPHADLNLANNTFSGPLPGNWFGSFNSFLLSSNQLAGSIPDSWAPLVYNSVAVDLSNNKLQGAFGQVWFDGFGSPGKVWSTAVFHIILRSVGGTNGTFLCNWRFVECRHRRVVKIDMSNQGFQFSMLPDELALSTQLEVVDLSGNNILGGSLPQNYSAWGNLTQFRVRGPVTGELPAGYSAWANVKVFEVKNTQLSGTVPSLLFSSWRQLENFTIDGALITGGLPEPWACTNLTTYWVQNTPVTSNTLSPVWILDPRAASLTRMQMIGLGGTQLQLPSWTLLKEALRNTSWPLKAFSFSRSRLEGPIGPLMYYFPALSMFDLSSNDLTGIIPPDLSAANTLMFANFSRNAIRGIIPAGLVNAFVNGSVYGLDLSYNRLTGTLPADVTSSKLFNTLSLANNSLQGTVPANWAKLIANSQAFDGSNLMLSGQLPEVTSSVSVTSVGM